MNIPQRWLDVLRALQAAGFTEAFIGGGALRDLDNGREVKDVDIFLRHCGDRTFSVIENAIGYTGGDRTQHHSEYSINFPDVRGVYEFASDATDADPFDFSVVTQPFNIIACSGPEGDDAFLVHHVARFDLGICRIGMRDDLTEYRALEYLRDKGHRTISVLNPRERSLERAERIRDRAYHDWRIVPYASFDVT